MKIQNFPIMKKDILLEARKLKPGRKNVSFRLREDLYDSLMDFCQKNEVRSANIIELLIERLLKEEN